VAGDEVQVLAHIEIECQFHHDPGVANGSEQSPDPRSSPSAEPIRTVLASDLLGRAGVLRIDLDGEIYTLRLTRNHRLILTK
jgi:hemin uptake protein HemP